MKVKQVNTQQGSRFRVITEIKATIHLAESWIRIHLPIKLQIFLKIPQK